MSSTQKQSMTETQLKRIAMLCAAKPEEKVVQLMRFFNEDSLRACYCELDGRKAKGSDGIDKAKYGEKLNENLKKLVERMKAMAYIPGAVRQVLIPKEGKPGATRPLGISTVKVYCTYIQSLFGICYHHSSISPITRQTI